MWHIVRWGGDLALIPVEEPIPDGAEVIGQTVDPEALSSPVPPVPYSVTRFQARAALALTTKEVGGQVVNLFDAIDDFMSALPRTDLRRRAWYDAQDFERDSPTAASIAALFGLTDEEVDDLFRLADTIKA